MSLALDVMFSPPGHVRPLASFKNMEPGGRYLHAACVDAINSQLSLNTSLHFYCLV